MLKSHRGVILDLLRIGKILGYDTYTAHKSESCRGIRLGDIATKKDVSQYVQPDRVEIVGRIDIVWLRRDVIRYCFEVVITTDMRVAALRLSQVPTAEKLYIVGPQANRRRFNRLKEIPEFRRTWEKFEFIDVAELNEYLEILIAESEMRRSVFRQ